MTNPDSYLHSAQPAYKQGFLVVCLEPHHRYPPGKMLSPTMTRLSLQEYESRFKGTGHYWLLLKINVSIKTYLVTSNGELVIVKTLRETAPSEVM